MMRELGQFYTSTSISDLLIHNIHQTNPNIILELGVGDGALINAAIKRWSSASFITADISNKPAILDSPNVQHSHAKINALTFNLSSKLGIIDNCADVALCNPPYIRPKWKKAYAEILEEAGLSGAIPSIKQASADVLFIAQNLRLLRDEGELGIIVPDGLISGSKYKKVRKILLGNHKLKSVIQLPNNVFQKTEAQTHIIILSKNGGSADNMPLYKASHEGKLSKPIFINQDEAIERLDYKFHCTSKNQLPGGNAKTLLELGADIRRGNLTWKESRENNVPCFHTTKFSDIKNTGRWRTDLRLLKKHSQIYLTAKVGDILLARVGRNLVEQIVYVDDGETIISDCVYRIRINKKYAKKVYKYLKSEDGKMQLTSYTNGVCAKSLSKTALLNIKIKL